MTDTLTKVVVDCTLDPIQQAAIDLIAEGVDMLRQGDVDGGNAKIQQGQELLDAGPATNPITVQPLTDNEISQHQADQEIGRQGAVDALKVDCDAALAATDWTQIADASDRLPNGTTAADWATYRQAVYDRRQQITDAANPPAWPASPAPLAGLPEPS